MLTPTFFPAVFRNGTRCRNPYGGFGRFQEEMNRLFEPTRRPVTGPTLNVWSNDEEAIVQADLPGFAPEDVEISIERNALTLRGNRKAGELKEGETYLRRERWNGKFSRTLELPFKVNGDDVKAEFKNGVLSVSLPRAAEDKPRKIAVKAA